ncbi:MAG: hypothetical protein AB1521_03195 [Bacteroidota bacterium]
MNRKKSYELDEEMIDKIISVAYNDANIFDRIFVRRAAKRNDNVKKLLQTYRNTAIKVHNLREEDCPEEIIDSLKQKSIPLRITKNAFGTDLAAIVFGRPLVSAIASIVVIAAIIVALFSTREIRPVYSRQEIEYADKQTRQALAIVGKIFNQTGTTLKREVLNDRVSKPIKDGLEIVNNIFN